ncbi:MAG: ATP-dependent metallopeptidase FtsH/Yme1/Tma family protein [Candidatus Hydrogenedentota bacterium]|nr:MAG: ATP-dependent metallopeptidase FtsH/Yme1/Tma family protein [Candidatus Hydrogenedentota bacterium]
MKQRNFVNLGIWLLFFFVLMLVWQKQTHEPKATEKISYSKFWQLARDGKVRNASIDNQEGTITGELANGKKYLTYIIATDLTLAERLEKMKVPEYEAKEPESEILQNFLYYWAPTLLLIGVLWFFFFRQVNTAGNRAFSFGKSRAKLLTEERPKTTFADVAGIEESKAELEEIIEFLKEPARFTRLGARIPKGVLLVGPPGTGKTLLAKAIAGEANVPFFSISGSDFVEMFVGVGASRVRDLFEQGKRNAPCIIFIDEIDAVGRHRGWGMGGGHDEREQTLNALLVEMDGFETKEGVVLLAATNRPDILDPALLRPGRFDRRVVVDLPDLDGRLGILKVHTRNVPLSPSVDLKLVARGTPFFSGADLANLVNEAALLAARRGRNEIIQEDLEDARDKVMMGPERRTRKISEKEKRIVAYHEAGHAIVARKLPGTDPVHKVTLIPRGIAALGATYQLPERDRYLKERGEYQAEMAVLMGGRVAEEIVFGEITGGAGNDIRRATDLARKMVCEWGMSEKLGPLAYGERQEELFLGRDIQRVQDYSESTAREIDAEIRMMVTEAYTRAREILLAERQVLDRVAAALLEREVLDGEEIEILISGGTLEDLRARQAAGASDAPASGGLREEEPSVPESPGGLEPATQPA